MPERKRNDGRIEPIYDVGQVMAGIGVYVPSDPRVTTFSSRGESSNYLERLFQSAASRALSKSDYQSMIRSGSLSLVLYMLTTCLCAIMTAVSLYCLVVELATQQTFILITGYFPGGYIYYNLDPLFFMLFAALGLTLALALFWAAIGKTKKLRMIDYLKSRAETTKRQPNSGDSPP